MSRFCATLCLAVFSIATFSTGEISSPRIALSSQVNPFTIADLFSSIGSSSAAYEPSCKLGFRFYPIDMLGMDLNYGMLFNSGNERDSVHFTLESPSYRNIRVDLGILINVAQGENASLGLVGQYGMSFQKWYDYTSPSFTQNRYVYYNVLQQSIFLGLEPAYYLSKNFALYSVFGFNVVFVPNSMEIDNSNPSYNPITNTYPMRTLRDAKTSIVTNGFSLGMRYLF